jgi:hypothetical protein
LSIFSLHLILQICSIIILRAYNEILQRPVISILNKSEKCQIHESSETSALCNWESLSDSNASIGFNRKPSSYHYNTIPYWNATNSTSGVLISYSQGQDQIIPCLIFYGVYRIAALTE